MHTITCLHCHHDNDVAKELRCGKCSRLLLETAPTDAESVRCSALLGELGAALSLLNKAQERPAHEWSDRTNFEFIVDVIRDLEDIVATEWCHSPNDQAHPTAAKASVGGTENL